MKNQNRKIIFGLGSNLGNRELHLEQAVDFLYRELSLQNIKKSQIFPNKALLKEGSPKEWDIDFLNIAISADIDLEKFSPEKILEIITAIEKNIGRQHTVNPSIIWAPREIDIDILAIDDLTVDLKGKLKIPHHALLERDFFLRTFSEIEPQWRYPIEGLFFQKTIAEIYDSLFSPFLRGSK